MCIFLCFVVAQNHLWGQGGLSSFVFLPPKPPMYIWKKTVLGHLCRQKFLRTYPGLSCVLGTQRGMQTRFCLFLYASSCIPRTANFAYLRLHTPQALASSIRSGALYVSLPPPIEASSAFTLFLLPFNLNRRSPPPPPRSPSPPPPPHAVPRRRRRGRRRRRQR